MSLERLFCPDFSAIFGDDFANPFLFPNLDSQIWPLFTDLDMTEFKEVKNLAEIKIKGHPAFYFRKISTQQLFIELESGGFGGAFIQALEIGRDYGIPNRLIYKIAKKYVQLRAILSLNVDKTDLDKGRPERLKQKLGALFDDALKKGLHEEDISAIVIYPGYFNFDIYSPGGYSFDLFEQFVGAFKVLEEKNIPLKLDVSDLHLPFLNYNNIARETISSFVGYLVSKLPELKIIIAGASYPADLPYYIDIFKFNRNVNIEINHRTFGGMSPSGYLSKVLELPGFVQNWWSRVMIGSATPTLEPSQAMLGLVKATEGLPFSQKSLLRIWTFRNCWRIYNISPQKVKEFNNSPIYMPFINKLGIKTDSAGGPNKEKEDGANGQDGSFTNNIFKSYSLKYANELNLVSASPPKSQNNKDKGPATTENINKGRNINIRNVKLGYDIHLQSFSITQLVSFQDIIIKIFKEIQEKYKKIEYGTLILKSYHTTTSIVMNEHEFGNYLEFHYYLAEKTMESADNRLHTVAALENRADFNFPDHITASSYGQRSITINIRNNKLNLGGRENYYALITFGPRKVNISADFDLVIH
ncbi:MAG: YjbQ family protein [Promethearchaeota archaeon]